MAEETRIEAVGCALHPFERNRYFYGKLMTVRDFEIEQRYLIGKDHLINRHVHGTGIACGLELQESHRENGNLFVALTARVALNRCGNEISLVKQSTACRCEGSLKTAATMCICAMPSV